MATHEDWQRLAERVKERRAVLGLTQEDVRAAGGPSTATMRLIEGALQDSFQPFILTRLDRALGWEIGSSRRILEGGAPVPAAGTPAGGFPAVTAEQPAEDEGIPSWEDMTPEERQLAQRWIAILRKTQGRRAG